MENANKIIGKKLSLLRKNAKLTQLELADKFNYSDKSISKWESGESLPSIDVLIELTEFYGVTLNDLLTDELPSNQPTEQKTKKPKKFPAKPIVTLLATCAVWLVATILYVLLLIIPHINYFMAFLWAIPASCIMLVIFNSIWGHYKYLFPILSVFMWSVIACIHIQVLIASSNNIWPIYILGAPLQVLILLWEALVKRPKDYYKNKKQSALKSPKPQKQEIEQTTTNQE